jgi:signal transduction histidine kinase
MTVVLRDLPVRLAGVPRLTIRLRLTATYGGLFLVCGAGLLAITYVLVRNSIVTYSYSFRPPTASFGPRKRLPAPSSGLSVAQANALLAGQRASELHHLLLYSGSALAIMAIMSVALGWVVAGRALRPVRTITAAARGISATSLDRRLSLGGPADELKELGDTFDELLGRLEASFAAQRQFVANASHELRTPLAWQRTLIQVALADPDADAQSLRAAHERVLASGVEQERIIEALLTLTRGHAGLDKREPFDLALLATRVLHARRSEARDLQLTVHTALAPAPTAGDPRLAERLIANLTDNALRHNAAGGEVEVITCSRNTRAILSVTNTGPIVPAAAVDRILQPFQRLGADRTGQGNGLGLGLSIVQAIAQAHDAAVAIRPQSSGGLHIEISFPPPSARRGSQPGRNRHKLAEATGQPT